MMNRIVMLFTLQGQIIGELIETLNLEVGIRLKNPVMVINQGTGVSPACGWFSAAPSRRW
mgnify:CR=1 FL=1